MVALLEPFEPPRRDSLLVGPRPAGSAFEAVNATERVVSFSVSPEVFVVDAQNRAPGPSDVAAMHVHPSSRSSARRVTRGAAGAAGSDETPPPAEAAALSNPKRWLCVRSNPKRGPSVGPSVEETDEPATTEEPAPAEPAPAEESDETTPNHITPHHTTTEGTSRKGAKHSGKGQGLTTVEAAALIEKAGLVSVNKGKKGKEGATQAEPPPPAKATHPAETPAPAEPRPDLLQQLLDDAEKRKLDHAVMCARVDAQMRTAMDNGVCPQQRKTPSAAVRAHPTPCLTVAPSPSVDVRDVVARTRGRNCPYRDSPVCCCVNHSTTRSGVGGTTSR